MSTSSVAVAATPIWDMDTKGIGEWLQSINVLIPKTENPNNSDGAYSEKVSIGKRLLQNLLEAVQTLMSEQQSPTEDPPTKRQKTEELPEIPDPHGIWIGQTEEVPKCEGSVLVQLTIAGLVNALAGQAGGIVDAKMMSTMERQTMIPTATTTLGKLRNFALAMHRAIQTRVEGDFLATTPSRIQTMLCPELSDQEFRSTRKRVYETVIEGRGRNLGGEDGDDTPVAARVAEHDIERDKKCTNCGNNEQTDFIMDAKNGDIICQNCGAVVIESLMHEGSQFRKFEGEIDRNHHGDIPNRLYSNSHNMATTLGGVQVMSAAGGGGFGTQSKGLETVLRNAHAYTELNISQFGKGERKTRIGYKDRQKKDAFVQMTHVGDALHLHEAVIQRSKELFAGFRDDRELVQQFKGVIAACLCVAFDQLSKDGMQIMKARQAQDSEALMSSRANRRNELHNASMAGKGGTQLDMSKVDVDKVIISANVLEHKPATTWDLDDCRSWLLESSRKIAEQWMQAKKDGSTNIPKGSKEELEGQLVDLSFSLCDQLEGELMSRDAVNCKKSITPRVGDMAHLSIKWQHAHERGSGGKGGVGNSGRTISGKKPGEHAGRTAGQTLILKTAKKLGSMLNDSVAGDAIHKELRAVVERQNERKRKELRDEASRQRLQQMKRKPWLQAKVEETV